MAVHLHLALSYGHENPAEHHPVSWHGQVMDGWRFFQHTDSDSSSTGSAYQGSAVKGSVGFKEISIGKGEDDPYCKGTGMSGSVVSLPIDVRASVGGDFTGEVEKQPGGTGGQRCHETGARPCTVFAFTGGNARHLPSSNITWKEGEAIATATPTHTPVTRSTGEAPGGVWVTAPNTGSTVGGAPLSLAARAYPSDGVRDPVSHVEFTAWWPGLGDENAPWFVACSVPRPNAGDRFECTFDIARVPPGELKLSFDVYDSAGRHRLAPNGKRIVTRGAGTPVPPKPIDTDGDGVPDSSDSCRTVPGPLSNKGCPATTQPTDSDGDGVPDSSDNCRTVPGPSSNRGCPTTPQPTDTDGDGVPDSSDSCRTVPGPASNNGCPISPTPIPDTDGDGVLDNVDNCRTERGPASNNGCPVTPTPIPDTDGDGVPDNQDECRTTPGPASNHGCPPPPVNYTLSLTTNRTSVNIGDDLTICYRLSPENVPFQIVVTKTTNGVYGGTVLDLPDNGVGGGGCVPSTVGGPAGTRVYSAQAFVNGQLVASATATITVGAGPGGGGTCTEFPGAPTNLFVFGTVGGSASRTRTIQWSPGPSGGTACAIVEYQVFNNASGALIYSGASTSAQVTVATGCSAVIGVQQRNQRGWGPTAHLTVSVC